MVYSCAYFGTAEGDLDTAQQPKLDYVCRKLRRCRLRAICRLTLPAVTRKKEKGETVQ
jgi:hypothetical protein